MHFAHIQGCAQGRLSRDRGLETEVRGVDSLSLVSCDGGDRDEPEALRVRGEELKFDASLKKN